MEEQRAEWIPASLQLSVLWEAKPQERLGVPEWVDTQSSGSRSHDWFCTERRTEERRGAIEQENRKGGERELF